MFVEEARGGAIVRIRVTPRSSRPGVKAAADWLAVGVRAPAEKGKATEEALRTLAEALGLPRRALTLSAGATARNKRVRVEGHTASDLRKRVEERLGGGG